MNNPQHTHSVAIIGMSCRFPGGANSPAEFWKLLESGVDAIGDIPPSRWDKDQFYDADGKAPGKMNTMRGGFMDIPVDRFDPSFFNISPREATVMDPQQRILLELSWEALEDAGINPQTIRGGDAGVFIGVSSVDYATMCIHDTIDHVNSYSLTGNCYSALAGRISFVLGLEGPSIAIDTACSSSLVAIDNACAYLRLRKTGLALAGGFNLMLSPDMQICLTKLQALSPDGLCKTFDAEANGYVRSEGGGLVVLKRLDDALADGDRILGVIRGSFVNQDGESTGISAPNGKMQEKVIRSALRDAGISEDRIDYIETHGTGTRVGDRTELTAIGNVMKAMRDQSSPLLVGSVKSNIGHLEAASGIAGLQKVILSLENGFIPGNLHFNRPNPAIAWDSFPLRVVDRNTPWIRGERPRIAGISSYGFVGTNSHLILEEPPLRENDRPSAARPFHTLLISAKTPEALKHLIKRYIVFLRAAEEDQLAHICHTAAAGRAHFEFRAAAHGRDPEEISGRLAELLEDDSFLPAPKEQQIVFLYTGQGSQYFGMGRQLYATEPVFKEALELCDQLYREIEGESLLELIHTEGEDHQKLNNTRYAQPLIFSIEYALTQLWLSFGVQPAATAGHSVGEYMAACLAGVIDVRDAMRLVAIRGRLMGSVPGKGLMAAIFTSREEVESLLCDQPGVAIAALNAPDSIVIGGFEAAILPVLEKLKEKGIPHEMLNVSHAFHSPQMDPVLDDFRKAVEGIRLHEPRIPLISNVTARKADAGLLTDPEYWVRHLRGTVRMSESLAFLGAEGYSVFLELGPKPALIQSAKRCMENPQITTACSMKQRVPDLLTLSEALGELYRAGVNYDWTSLEKPFGARKVSIPTYPFSGQRYWVDLTAASRPQGKSGEPAGLVSIESDPIIGQRIETPALPETALFQMDIRRGQHYFFEQHVILGIETAPGAALLSWVWRAARQLFPDEPFKMEEVNLTQPLILYDEDRVGQIIVRNLGALRSSFEFSSRESGSDAGSWVTHCKGWIVKGELPLPEPITAEDIRQIGARADFHISGEAFYESMESFGYHYGPLFKGIESASSAAGEILCEWRSPQRDAGTEAYWVTPGDLDIIFQTPAVALMKEAVPATGSGTIHVPFYIRGIAFYRQLVPGPYRVLSRTRATVEEVSRPVESFMYLLNEQNELCATIEGFVSAAVSRQEILREEGNKLLNRLIYEEEWKLQPLPPSPQKPVPPGRVWILFGNQENACQALAEKLSPHGRVCVVRQGSVFEVLGEDTYQIDAERPESCADLFGHLALDSRDSLRIIHFLPSERRVFEKTDRQDIQKNLDDRLRTLLHLTQALPQLPSKSRLYIVTTGNQKVKGDDAPALMRSVGADGFAAVARLEHPELQVTRIALSCSPEDNEISALTAELLAESDEMLLSLCHDQRYAARLVRWKERNRPETAGLTLPQGDYTLELPESGGFDDLSFSAIEAVEPGPREVEFEVISSGLNFKDVLRALGELKSSANRIGGEAAGIVTRVGSEVKGFKPGDPVVSWEIAGGGFSSRQIASERCISLKPEFLTFEEASTVPISFMSAYHALFELGGLKKGERALIHAGAGGVGMAAVQLALDTGAEVFSTAGSEAKRALLKQMGVAHVFSSRTLDFSRQIMEITDGKGVQLALNALTGDFLKQTMLALAEGGRFIELGKREILTPDQVRAIHPDASYQAFDLTDVIANSPDGRKDIMDEIFRKFAHGSLKPLPLHIFPIQNVNQAFRFMSQARHTGRIAISHRDALRRKSLPGDVPLHHDGAYLITGGLGGLGLEIAARLASHPVGTIILTGRRPPSEAVQAKIEAMKTAGTDLMVVTCDISDRKECETLFERLRENPNRLRGVIHAAGVLEDRSILQQSWDSFARTLAPKVQGGWNLHEATKEMLLDFFVLFSSASSTIGNRGQSNYAAGNSFMNDLACYRRALGLPAISICWGPWAEVGMAADGDQPGLKMARNGILPISLSDGITALFSIIQKDPAVPTVLDMNWNLFFDTIPENLAATLYEKIKGGKGRTGSAPVQPDEAETGGSRISPLQQIQEAAPEERIPLIIAMIRKIVARVMGYDDSSMVQTDISLTRMGIDSLMAMDFRSNLEKRISITLPFALLSDNSSLKDIAVYIDKEMHT